MVMFLLLLIAMLAAAVTEMVKQKRLAVEELEQERAAARRALASMYRSLHTLHVSSGVPRQFGCRICYAMKGPMTSDPAEPWKQP
jgi:hypothetical protein